jgi:hypothetical protein
LERLWFKYSKMSGIHNSITMWNLITF